MKLTIVKLDNIIQTILIKKGFTGIIYEHIIWVTNIYTFFRLFVATLGVSRIACNISMTI